MQQYNLKLCHEHKLMLKDYVTFIHVVLQAPPTQVHLSSIQSKWLLTRELGEDEVTELSLQLQE